MERDDEGNLELFGHTSRDNRRSQRPVADAPDEIRSTGPGRSPLCPALHPGSPVEFGVVDMVLLALWVRTDPESTKVGMIPRLRAGVLWEGQLRHHPGKGPFDPEVAPEKRLPRLEQRGLPAMRPQRPCFREEPLGRAEPAEAEGVIVD